MSERAVTDEPPANGIDERGPAGGTSDMTGVFDGPSLFGPKTTSHAPPAESGGESTDPSDAGPPRTGSQQILVSGGGDLAIATDEMLAKAEALHAMHEQSLPLSRDLHDVSSELDPGQYSVGTVVAVALADAEDALIRARVRLVQAGLFAGEIADAMDAAALAYGEVENDLMNRFVQAQGAMIGLAISLITIANPLPAILIPFALWFFGESIRDAVGGEIGAESTEVPGGINRWVSDPANVMMIRLSVMSMDDALAALFHVPNLGDGGDMARSAGMLMVLSSFAGLLRDGPVSTERTATRTGVRAADSLEDLADGLTSAADGDTSQVRIDVIRETGRPDRFQVYIGGTADFSPLAKEEPFDMTSNVEMVAHLPAGALEGVKRAMAEMGITASSEVQFAGHSQGGLIAQTLAASGQYNTSALVTFGSPGGGVIVPSGVPAILFENVDDIVPALGGRQLNTDAVIVQGRAFETSADVPTDLSLPAHRIEPYSDLARIADRDAASSKVAGVRDVVGSFADGATSVSSNYYRITRAG